VVPQIFAALSQYRDGKSSNSFSLASCKETYSALHYPAFGSIFLNFYWNVPIEREENTQVAGALPHRVRQYSMQQSPAKAKKRGSLRTIQAGPPAITYRRGNPS
jgi:hypothetical protein